MSLMAKTISWSDVHWFMQASCDSWGNIHPWKWGGGTPLLHPYIIPLSDVFSCFLKLASAKVAPAVSDWLVEIWQLWHPVRCDQSAFMATIIYDSYTCTFDSNIYIQFMVRNIWKVYYSILLCVQKQKYGNLCAPLPAARFLVGQTDVSVNVSIVFCLFQTMFSTAFIMKPPDIGRVQIWRGPPWLCPHCPTSCP